MAHKGNLLAFFTVYFSCFNEHYNEYKCFFYIANVLSKKKVLRQQVLCFCFFVSVIIQQNTFYARENAKIKIQQQLIYCYCCLLKCLKQFSAKILNLFSQINQIIHTIRRSISTVTVVYLCIIFESMHSIFALSG